MIRLNYLKGVNIGRHRLVEKHITGNVLGLWGVSGAGKSTVLQLVEWLINGKIEHPDPIAEFVRSNEAEEIKKMEGLAHFTVDGKPMEIERSHSKAGTSTREIRWDKQGSKWGTKEKSAAGAEALMTSLVGANQKAISSIVFVRQGAFGKLFSGLDSDRRDFFVRLLMLGHLEKIASVVDTYRKELMGSVKDLSVPRDQAVEAYSNAEQYFNEVDFDLSRMRSYKPELDAGAELVRLGDQLVTRESDFAARAVALDTSLAGLGLTRDKMDDWLQERDATLAAMRERLRAATDRRKSRATYEASKAKLTAEITEIKAWLEKSAQHDALTERLKGMAEDADKPDPRIRMRQLDEWERKYQEADALVVKLQSLPAADMDAVEKLGAEAEKTRQDAAESYNKWSAAKADLADLIKLREAAKSQHSVENCRLCGNDHPDPKFLEAAITNTQELAARLSNDSNLLEDRRREAAEEFTEARNTATTRAEQIAAANKALTDTRVALADAPDISSLILERNELAASLDAYDAAKSLRLHLMEEQRLVASAMGSVTYTKNDLAGRSSELSLADQMLGMLPPLADLDSEIQELTDNGMILKTSRDAVANHRDQFNLAREAMEAQRVLLQSTLATLTKERPFLISSIQALGPVITDANRDKVLENLREKQTKFAEQTGLAAAARRALTEADKALQEIEVRIEEQKGRIQISKELEAVRAAFMPSGITTDYLSHQFERIAIAAQDHLAQMSADFMVISSEKRALSFDFVRLNEPNGSWLNQNRMSGGQQVKLAIAVLLAIHELIIPQVGLLVLDEPSTHLDTESKIALAEVLREIGQRGNFQLIVCDHSQELKDAYTDIIELFPDPV